MIRYVVSAQVPIGEVVFDSVFGKNGRTKGIKPLLFQQNGENTAVIPGNDKLYVVNMTIGETIGYDYVVTGVAFNGDLGIVFSTEEGIFAIDNPGDAVRKIADISSPVVSNLVLIGRGVFFIDSTGTLQKVGDDGKINGLEFFIPATITAEEMLFEVHGNLLVVYGGEVLLLGPEMNVIDRQILSSHSSKNLLQSGKLWCFSPKYNTITALVVNKTNLKKSEEFPLNATHLLGFSKKTGNILSMTTEANDLLTLQCSPYSNKGALPERILSGLQAIDLSQGYILLDFAGNLLVLDGDDLPNQSIKNPPKALQIRKSSRLKPRFYCKNIGNEEYLFLQEGSRITVIRLGK